MRNSLNNREDELLLGVDQKFDSIYFNDKFIKDTEKLQNKILISLEKGKKLNHEWNENNLYLLMNHCINIENHIKDIDLINENINKFKNSKTININFTPDENQIIGTLEKIKQFGKLNNGFLFDNSKIIGNNTDYITCLKQWINLGNNNEVELLYRLSDNGEEFSKFHNFCDNKGPTLVLFHTVDGNKVGIFTPLLWDSNSGEKIDDKTFLFNLNKKTRYPKKRDKNASIYCKKRSWTLCLSFWMWFKL